MALQKLYTETYPQNIDLKENYIKVTTLNSFYSAHIFDKDMQNEAEHIYELKIDNRLHEDDLTLVPEMSSVGNGIKKCYSFASKSCSFHKPEVYPIYDGYLDNLLWFYKKRTLLVTS